jgi:exopolysaccharide production protein ExoQ
MRAADALWVLLAAGLAAGVGYVGAWNPQAFGIAAGAAFCVALIAVADRRPDLVISGGCFLVLLAGTKFRSRHPGESLSGAVDAQVLAELGMYALLGLAIAVVWLRRPLRGWRPGFMEGTLLLYFALAALSVAWSASPAFSLVRVLQLGTLLAIALIAPAVLGARETLRALMRAVVVYVLVFAALAAVFPWADGTISDYTGIERFSWFSIHPITAATYAGLGVLLLIAARVADGARAARVLGVPWWLLVPALAGVVLLAASRGPLLALVAGVGALLLVRYLPAWGSVLVTAFGLVLVATVVIHGAAIDELLSSGANSGGPIAQLLFRGQSVEELTSLTGRIQLWTDAARLGADKPLIGHGYQAARVLLLDLRPVAGYAHNALLQTALDLGLAGVLLLFVPVVCVLRAGIATGRAATADRFARIAAFGAAVFLLLNAVTSESFAGAPGFEVLLVFTCVVVQARMTRSAAPVPDRAAVRAPATITPTGWSVAR